MDMGHILKPNALQPGGDEQFGEYMKHMLDVAVCDIVLSVMPVTWTEFPCFFNFSR